MNEEKPSIARVLHTNRKLVMALLGVPVLAMLIAVILLIYKNPDNLIVILGVILFVAVQYILMMFFFMKKIEALVNKETEVDVELEQADTTVSEDAPKLIPEEERVLPIKEEEN